jgi:hypothetical protein
MASMLFWRGHLLLDRRGFLSACMLHTVLILDICLLHGLQHKKRNKSLRGG